MGAFLNIIVIIVALGLMALCFLLERQRRELHRATDRMMRIAGYYTQLIRCMDNMAVAVESEDRESADFFYKQMTVIQQHYNQWLTEEVKSLNPNAIQK